MQNSKNLSVVVNKILDKRKIFQYNTIEVIKMIERESYIEKVRPFYESDLIKIIPGIRRSGKSIILEQIIQVLDGWQDACKTLRLYDYTENFFSCQEKFSLLLRKNQKTKKVFT